MNRSRSLALAATALFAALAAGSFAANAADADVAPQDGPRLSAPADAKGAPPDRADGPRGPGGPEADGHRPPRPPMTPEEAAKHEKVHALFEQLHAAREKGDKAAEARIEAELHALLPKDGPGKHRGPPPGDHPPGDHPPGDMPPPSAK